MRFLKPCLRHNYRYVWHAMGKLFFRFINDSTMLSGYPRSTFILVSSMEQYCWDWIKCYNADNIALALGLPITCKRPLFSDLLARVAPPAKVILPSCEQALGRFYNLCIICRGGTFNHNLFQNYYAQWKSFGKSKKFAWLCQEYRLQWMRWGYPFFQISCCRKSRRYWEEAIGIHATSSQSFH